VRRAGRRRGVVQRYVVAWIRPAHAVAGFDLEKIEALCEIWHEIGGVAHPELKLRCLGWRVPEHGSRLERGR